MIQFILNNQVIETTVKSGITLLDFIRENQQLKGTKIGCREGDCGACTVFLDGETVNTCLIFAVEAHGSEIKTIEGLGDGDALTDLQQAFVDYHSVQCGYCIPGMILSGEQILKDISTPDREEIKHGLAGNICRCTGYHKIIDAIEMIANERKKTQI